MTMAVGYGIVLRNELPERRILHVLDRTKGLVRATTRSGVPAERIFPSMLLRYVYSDEWRVQMLTDIDVVAKPAAWAYSDLAFVHHVLELCNSFCQPNDPVVSLFDTLICWYEHNQLFDKQTLQQLLVVRVLTHLGLYPCEKTVRSAHFKHFMQMPVDTLTSTFLDLKAAHAIFEWLCSCAAQHPYLATLKTWPWLRMVTEQKK